MFLALAGCGSSSSDGSPERPRLTPGGCGSSHDWLPDAEVGTVVSSEELTDEARSADTVETLLAFAGMSSLSPVPYGARVFRMRYTTQDRGRAVQATGLIAVPWNDGEPAFDAPVLLELHGTTGFSAACAPSGPALAHDVALGLTVLASRGFVVVAPDFIGLDADADPAAPPDPRHGYLSAEQVAVGSLDMVRAARTLVPEQPGVSARPTRELYLWGASQGGHAVFATELYAPYYAPEFELSGAVALVPPTDLLGLAAHALTVAGPTTVALAGAMVSLDRYYSDGSSVGSLLTDEPPTQFASQLPALMDSTCDPTQLFENIDDVSQIFQPEALAHAQADSFAGWEPFGCYASENSFATTSVERHSDTPFLFVLGENDDLVHSPVEREDFDRLCSRGYRMQYLECAGAGHVEGATWSIPEQVRWLEARVRGEPLPSDAVCQRGPPTACEGQK